MITFGNENVRGVSDPIINCFVSTFRVHFYFNLINNGHGGSKSTPMGYTYALIQRIILLLLINESVRDIVTFTTKTIFLMINLK